MTCFSVQFTHNVLNQMRQSMNTESETFRKRRTSFVLSIENGNAFMRCRFLFI